MSPPDATFDKEWRKQYLREYMREYMRKRRGKAVAPDAYLDDRFPERACDRCGKLYRGPAVYCSLTCAIADA